MIKRTFINLVLVLSFSLPAYAELSISTDHRSLFFGIMQLGEEKELAQQGSHHNEVTCSSTGANTWYLKINLLQPLSSTAAEAEEMIPVESFKWQFVWTDGKGTAPDAYQFKSFSLTPDLVYMSGPDEANGNSINFQFKYYLKIPESQTSGVYSTTIRFTLTEIL